MVNAAWDNKAAWLWDETQYFSKLASGKDIRQGLQDAQLNTDLPIPPDVRLRQKDPPTMRSQDAKPTKKKKKLTWVCSGNHQNQTSLSASPQTTKKPG